MTKTSLKQAIAALGLASAAIIAGPAQGATITNADGTFNWTGFDWAQGGTAWTTDFQAVAGDTFTLNFMSWAVALQNTPATFVPAGMDINANGAADGTYEYTVVATLNETVTGCVSLIPGTTTCGFALTSGTFDIYYDTTPNADSTLGSLGTGFTDGDLLISGTFGAQPGGTFTSDGTNGSGNSALIGSVTATNLTYINPSLVGTVVGTELKIGNLVTNWVNPGGFGGVAFADGAIVMQADANQNFSVPEPATLALFGIAMIAGGVARRQAKKNQ